MPDKLSAVCRLPGSFQSFIYSYTFDEDGMHPIVSKLLCWVYDAVQITIQQDALRLMPETISLIAKPGLFLFWNELYCTYLYILLYHCPQGAKESFPSLLALFELGRVGAQGGPWGPGPRGPGTHGTHGHRLVYIYIYI